MIAERTYEVSLIRDILMDPDIFGRITDDSHARLEIDPQKECWVAMKLGTATDRNVFAPHSDIAGVYCLHSLNAWTMQIHAHVLPQFREEYAMATGRAILKWFLEHTEYLKVVAEIPTCFPDVLKFTKKFGFKEEGCNRQSLMKDGELVDQVWLGITRSEIEELF